MSVNDVVFSSNLDVATKALATTLNDKLKEMINYTDAQEFSKIEEGILSLSSKRLQDDIEALIAKSIKESDNVFPRVILTKSKTFEPTPFAKTLKHLNTFDYIEIVNTADVNEKFTMLGTRTEFGIPFSITILSKSDMINATLGMKITQILAQNSKIAYPLQLKNNSGELWALEDFGRVSIKGTNDISLNTVNDDGYIATHLEFRVLFDYMEFKEWGNILQEYTLEFTPKV